MNALMVVAYLLACVLAFGLMFGLVLGLLSIAVGYYAVGAR